MAAMEVSMDEFSIWHLILVLLIVVALFGTSKLRTVGGDLGHAIKGFRAATQVESDPGSSVGTVSHESDGNSACHRA